ncbi:MAG: phosphotransferase family protein [Caulobacteraceae bacterium]|nr:phosphotransferase family protein [Caulobacteraceae bacterium]
MSERATAKTEFDFDPAALRRWLASNQPNLTGKMDLERVGGGQSNPTYFVTIGSTRMVLRKRPVGELPKSAHDVGREYRILSALQNEAPPTPRPIAFCDTDEVIGTPFYLMERVEGRIFHDAALPEAPKAERRAYYREFARTLAALHAVDWRAGGMAELARPGRFLERQVDRWERAWTGTTATDPNVSRVADWLRRNMPDTDHLGIVHGDYKFTNVIFDPIRPRLAAVLDWELCAIGDPMADVAHCWSALWQTGPDEYGGVMGLDLDGFGLPTAEAFFADYYEAANDGRRMTSFYLALAHFRNAGIFHGIRQRAEAGTANAADAAHTGRLDRVYLERAFAVTEGAA